MVKILKYVFLGAFIFLLSAPFVQAKDAVNVYFFYRDGCPHCAKEEKFLDELEKFNDDVSTYRFEVMKYKENRELLQKVAKELKIPASGVPVTIIGSQSIVGYNDDETTGKEILNLINSQDSSDRDVVGEILKKSKSVKDGGQPSEQNNTPQCSVQNDDQCPEECDCNKKGVVNDSQDDEKKLKSVFGEFDLKKLSLPLITVLIGTLDSFNPCAMWVLLFLISMMITMNNRKKMWLLGGTFIFASAATYFVFMAAWLNIYMFLGWVTWLKTAIALVAVIAGVLNLRQYWKNRNGGCEISESVEKRKSITTRAKEIINHNSAWLAFFGIVALAVSVNMVELLCSAGLPAIYIPILTMANLPIWQYYLYILVYVFFYVLIQIVVFLIAMFTLEVKAVSSRITKWSTLVGGSFMLIIGLLLLLRPELLTFGQ